MKPLTDLQREVMRLIDDGLDYKQIAAVVNQTPWIVEKAHKASEKKMRGEEPQRHVPKGKKLLLERDKPEVAGEILAELSDSLTTVEEAAKRTGMPKRVIQSFMKRMRQKHQPVVTQMEKASDGQLIDLLKEKRLMGLHYMDDFAFAAAELRDLSATTATLTTNIQLLEGKPTAIIDDKVRAETNELMRKAIVELKRRGITIEANKVPYSEVPDEESR